MTLIDIAKRAEKLIIDNSPTILTVLGVTGTITTAYFAGTASFKAADIIADEQYRIDHHPDSRDLKTKEKTLEFKDKAELIWKLYIPAIGTGVLTIACIIFANRISARRATALAAAFSISEKALVEYKDKVIERIGGPKEQKIRDEVAQDHIDRNPVSERSVIITGNGDVLCYDKFSDRYFKSSMEELKKAQNDINYKIISDSYASLSEFYDKIGLAQTSYSEEVGWTLDNQLELKFSTTMSDDQRPCIAFEFNAAPVRNYHKLG